jgi:hypothetical protein
MRTLKVNTTINLENIVARKWNSLTPRDCWIRYSGLKLLRICELPVVDCPRLRDRRQGLRPLSGSIERELPIAYCLLPIARCSCKPTSSAERARPDDPVGRELRELRRFTRIKNGREIIHNYNSYSLAE